MAIALGRPSTALHPTPIHVRPVLQALRPAPQLAFSRTGSSASRNHPTPRRVGAPTKKLRVWCAPTHLTGNCTHSAEGLVGGV